VVSRLVRLRAERARLLGYPSHAAYRLEIQTAREVAAVNALLAKLARPAVENARREAAAMQELVDAENGGFRIAAHDWDFYSEKVRRARFAFDESRLRPYFEMNRVLVDGVFFAATRLYGITFRERSDLPKYHPDTRIFEVTDHDGSALALFVVDWYARPSKRGGAWMNAYVSQSTLLDRRPVIANHLNVPMPPPGEPTLLTYDEVTTAFHEFGHALHGMFSRVRYPRFSGTSVPRDFVEFPSQVNEMWMLWPSILTHYARHHRTGEPLPTELVDKVRAAQKFNQGFKTTEYLAASICSTRPGTSSPPRTCPAPTPSRPSRRRPSRAPASIFRPSRPATAAPTSRTSSAAMAIPPATTPTFGARFSTRIPWTGSSRTAV
jgi:peptidyl-dipeptidase Dcp